MNEKPKQQTKPILDYLAWVSATTAALLLGLIIAGLVVGVVSFMAMQAQTMSFQPSGINTPTPPGYEKVVTSTNGDTALVPSVKDDEQYTDTPSSIDLGFFQVAFLIMEFALAGLFMGIPLGVVQWLFLRTKVPRLNPFKWVFATVLGTGFIGAIVGIPETITSFEMLILAFVLGGLILACTQTIVIKKHVVQKLVWLAPSWSGWVFAALLAFGMTTLVTEVFIEPGAVTISPLAFLVSTIAPLLLFLAALLMPALFSGIAYAWQIKPAKLAQ